MGRKIRQWHGKDVKYKHIIVEVRENKEKPLYWYNYEVSLSNDVNGRAHVPAIEITTETGGTFRIANHFGVGVLKLRRGGWPDSPHFSLSMEFKSRPGILSFNCQDYFSHDDYSKHEAERRKWQKKNFPVDFENSERLRQLINQHK